MADPGWYPDPGGSGRRRWWDGSQWSSVVEPDPVAPPWPGYAPPYVPQWKGARYGRPAEGSGSLASPGRRFGARVLDWLVMAPVVLILGAIALAIVLPHAGELFPDTPEDPNASTPFPGFFWVELTLMGVLFLGSLLNLAYETIATAKYGRTLGKRWMKIRPLTTAGQPLGWGKSLARALLYPFVASMLSWIGLLDPLWCLWDQDSQCVHDKAVSTLVVND